MPKNNSGKPLTDDTYALVVFCANCSAVFQVYIPCGTSFNDWLAGGNIACPYCGRDVPNDATWDDKAAMFLNRGIPVNVAVQLGLTGVSTNKSDGDTK